MAFQKQASSAIQNRAQRIMQAWYRGDVSELRSVLCEKEMEFPKDPMAREQIEVVEASAEMMREWLQSPTTCGEADLKASIQMLRHVSATALPH
jgi:hypothetical protein